MEIVRVTELNAPERGIDISAQADEDGTRTHFDKALDAAARQFADGSSPKHRIGNLLDEALASLGRVPDQTGLPVVD